jgi:glycosyltransferase involved in cell wall biosynthesis
VYLELVTPLLDNPQSRAKWMWWLQRDLPWALREGWEVEYWGVRQSNDRRSSWQQVRVRGPRVPLPRFPWVLLALLAWGSHFRRTLFGRRGTILIARSPYLGLGAALARVIRPRGPALMVRIVERMPDLALRVYGSRFLSRLLGRIERFVLRKADLVVPIAGFTRQVAYEAGVAHERIVLLPNPPRWGSTELNEAEKVDPPRVVTAARLIRGKGIDTLLTAFASVADEVPGAELEIAGEGKERATLELLASRLGLGDRVHFRGWIPAHQMPAFFSPAMVAALPSRVEEGHPMALREAALAGCALVGTDLGGIRDIVQQEETGFLVPPENPEALAEALERLLRNPSEARKLGATAKKRALEYFQQRDEALHDLRRRVYELASIEPPLG